MAEVYLTQRDIDYISRVVATEVPVSLQQTDPEEYGRMVNAVVDTMVNRVASDSYPDTITGVANQNRQFSKITGPASLNPYGSVQATPKASTELQSMVAGRVADLAQGAESEIGGALSYANPNFSDASNLASWVNPMIEAGALQLGIGDMTHFHGLAPGQQAVTDVTVSAEGIPSGGIPVPYGPNDDPFAMSAQAQAIDGFSGLANPLSAREEVAMSDLPAAQKEPGEWGVINGVGPVYTPTFNQWGDMAAAAPVQAPMGSVTATGLLGATPSLSTNATVSGLLGAQPQAISQSDVDRALFNVTGAGQMDPAFTAGLMSPQNPVVPTAVESQSFTPGMQPTRAPVEIAQSDVDRGLFNVTGDGQLDPSFTAGLMGPQNPVVPTSVQSVSYTQGQEPSTEFASAPTEKTSRFGAMPNLADAARMSPLAGAIDPATNVTSFTQQPADIGGFIDAMTAQRGPATGVNSAEHQTQVANAMRQQFNPTIQAPAPVSEVATAGLLNNPAFASTNFNAAMNPSVPSLNVPSVTPSLASTYAAQQIAAPAQPAIDSTITGSTTPGLLSPTSITASTPTLTGGGSLTGGLNKSLLSDQPINQVGFLNDLTPNIDINLSGNIVPAAAPQIAAPALEAVEVADQPTVAATVDGPATTPATDQQTQITAPANTMADTTTSTTPATTSKSKGILSGLVSPEAAGLGLLGGLALGPAGGLLGALAGQQVARSGGLSSMFGGQPATINNIGGGMINTAAIWGGGTDPGTQATTSNGGFVTQMPSGLMAVTGPSGTTTGFDSTGKGYAMWGGTPGSDGETTASSSNSGGFFGGLFD